MIQFFAAMTAARFLSEKTKMKIGLVCAAIPLAMVLFMTVQNYVLSFPKVDNLNYQPTDMGNVAGHNLALMLYQSESSATGHKSLDNISDFNNDQNFYFLRASYVSPEAINAYIRQEINDRETAKLSANIAPCLVKQVESYVLGNGLNGAEPGDIKITYGTTNNYSVIFNFALIYSPPITPNAVYGNNYNDGTLAFFTGFQCYPNK